MVPSDQLFILGNNRASSTLRQHPVVYEWGICVITKRYVARQVAALLEFAKSTKNETLSAALVQRAADLKLRGVEAPRDSNNDLAAPDVLLGK